MKIKNSYKQKFGNRELEIKFNIHMDSKVDAKVITLLTDLFEKRNPISKIPKLRYVLRNKKRMMGGTVSIPKLFDGEALVYIDYPGMFKDNDKHNYKFKDLRHFDEEDFIDASIHETAHAYHCLSSKSCLRILRKLLECDKFKSKKFFPRLQNELKRFPLQTYFEGYAQIVDYFGKYYFFNKKDFRKQYSKIMNAAKGLNNAFERAIKNKDKKIFEKLNFEPYHLGTRIYYFIMYFDRKETFNSIIKHDINSLFNKFEKLIKKNNLEIPVSYDSGNGIFDLKMSLKEVDKMM